MLAENLWKAIPGERHQWTNPTHGDCVLMVDEMKAASRYLGWFVAWAACIIAVFVWGVGFYGPSVFLQTLYATRGWSIATISTAVTVHFLLSAAIVWYLPEIHRLLGIALTTTAGAVLSAIGLIAWSGAWEPWQLFAAATLSGAGWAVTSGAALNAMIAPWFERERPKALSLAFNGASVGGIVFVPLWVVLINLFGFLIAATLIALSMIIVIGTLAICFLRHGPSYFGLNPDGDVAAPTPRKIAPPASRFALIRNKKFITLSAAFALGLFAQIGLFAHLIVRMSPVIGTNAAAAAVSLAAICAVIGRTVMGWCIGDRDRRVAAAANFAIQSIGVFFLGLGSGPFPLWAGCVLFGLGGGNLTTLPPLIAQREFHCDDVAVVVALVVAINQATFAFAPAIFGALRETAASYQLPFLLAAIVQICAAIIVMIGRSQTSAFVIASRRS